MILANPHTPTITQAIFKACADDFVVQEIMDISFDGQGEHCWLFIQKTNLNTAFVAKLLATWANIAPKDVGFSGLKDRRAITDQWFSLRLPNKRLPSLDFINFAKDFLKDDEKLTLLAQHWHGKKLNRGTHKANRFTITLKDVQGDKTAIDAQLALIKTCGVPNYFGEQRFGKDGNNLPQAVAFFQKILSTDKPYRPHKQDRNKHALYISAAKSAIFNALLSQRVLMGCWDTPIDGDVFNLNGTGSVFCAKIDDVIMARLATGDIHPAGILYGTGNRLSSNQALMMENEILAQFSTFKDGLTKIGAKCSYRPFRLMAHEFQWSWQDDNLRLTFTLPTGAFATSIISNLMMDENAPTRPPAQA